MARFYIEIGETEVGFDVTQTGSGTVVKQVEGADDTALHADFVPVHASVSSGEGLYSLLADGKSYEVYVEKREQGFRVALLRHRFDVRVLTEREWRLQKVAPKAASATGIMTISAPMPGLVKGVVVAEGDEVKSGQRLVVLEAMKMENDILSPRDGQISAVHVTAGTVVEGGKPLVTLR